MNREFILELNKVNKNNEIYVSTAFDHMNYIQIYATMNFYTESIEGIKIPISDIVAIVEKVGRIGDDLYVEYELVETRTDVMKRYESIKEDLCLAPMFSVDEKNIHKEGNIIVIDKANIISFSFIEKKNSVNNYYV